MLTIIRKTPDNEYAARCRMKYSVYAALLCGSDGGGGDDDGGIQLWLYGTLLCAHEHAIVLMLKRLCSQPFDISREHCNNLR